MKNNPENSHITDIEQVKNFLTKLGFTCTSYPSAQHLIFCKEKETVIIKNSQK